MSWTTYDPTLDFEPIDQRISNSNIETDIDSYERSATPIIEWSENSTVLTGDRLSPWPYTLFNTSVEESFHELDFMRDEDHFNIPAATPNPVQVLPVYDEEFNDPANQAQTEAYSPAVVTISYNILSVVRLNPPEPLSPADRSNRFQLSPACIDPPTSIFPCVHFSRDQRRFRDTLSNGETAEQVREAYEFLSNLSQREGVTEEMRMFEERTLKSCIQSLANEKIRPIWSIVQLKSAFVTRCRIHFATKLHQSLGGLNHEVRDLIDNGELLDQLQGLNDEVQLCVQLSTMMMAATNGEITPP